MAGASRSGQVATPGYANTTPMGAVGGRILPAGGAEALRSSLQREGSGFGKGGGQTQPAPSPAMPQPQPMQPQTMAPQQGNIFQQAAGAQSQAQQTLGNLANIEFTPMQAAQLAPVERMQAVGQVADINAPGMIDVNQLATTDLGAYMSPYEQAVIETGQADIERQRQMASNMLGAQAQAAGAFGGSRQAVQEGVLAGEALRQAAQLSAQQRQRGFETALQSGQFDIGQMQAARTFASQQEMQARTLNQQAAEAAAAREQAARAGNMAAANQFAIQQAMFEQEARLANFNAQSTMAGIQSGAAGQLAGLGQQMFGQGQAITQQQQQFGQQQQALNQALIDAARRQYQGFVGAPQQSLGLPMQAVSAGNMGQQTTTQGYTPGLFDYLSLGAMTAGGFR